MSEPETAPPAPAPGAPPSLFMQFVGAFSFLLGAATFVAVNAPLYLLDVLTFLPPERALPAACSLAP